MEGSARLGRAFGSRAFSLWRPASDLQSWRCALAPGGPGLRSGNLVSLLDGDWLRAEAIIPVPVIVPAFSHSAQPEKAASPKHCFSLPRFPQPREFSVKFPAKCR